VRPDLPILIGAAAERILATANRVLSSGATFQQTITLSNRTEIQLGPFKITPYLVDHAAFDAYAIQIDADGQRLFYTGDIRAHGRKAKLFEALVARPPAAVDVLLMEGTTLSREGNAAHFATEANLEDDFVEAMHDTA